MTQGDPEGGAQQPPPQGTPEPPRGGRLAAWLERTRDYSWWRFLLTATLAALLLRVPVVWIAVPLVGEDARTAYDWLEQYSIAEMALIAILVGPVIETIVAQWLPVTLGRRLFHSDGYAVLFSAWLFGWLHYTQGVLLVLVMFSTGLVLAWTFVVWRERGLAQAFLMTTAVHAALNAVALAAAVLAPEAAGPPP